MKRAVRPPIFWKLGRRPIEKPDLPDRIRQHGRSNGTREAGAAIEENIQPRDNMARRYRKICLVLFLVACLPVVVLAMLSFFSRKPDNLGVVNGHLADCPATPNCVCTQCSDPEHHMEPLHFAGSPEEAMVRLRAVIAALQRSKIVTVDERYMHAEFTSNLFRFVDDVEFLIEPDTKTIQFRSASRVGRSDLGVNRQRMEDIRQRFDEK